MAQEGGGTNAPSPQGAGPDPTPAERKGGEAAKGGKMAQKRKMVENMSDRALVDDSGRSAYSSMPGSEYSVNTSSSFEGVSSDGVVSFLSRYPSESLHFFWHSYFPASRI